MRREFSITGLLKPEFINLPTDHIRAHHISFDLFCRKVEKASNIRLDAARDELGWVQEPRRPDEKQQYWGISNELTFQNALGVLQLYTTQSELPQALIFYLWSPAPKEPIFRRSRRAPLSTGCSVGDSLESEANSQQPSGSATPLVIHPYLNQSAKEANSPKPLGSLSPPVINPVSNQFGGADADVEMTISTPPTASPPTASPSKYSGSVQDSITSGEPQSQILISTNNCKELPADLGLSHHSDSEADAIEQGDSEVEHQEREAPSSLSGSSAASAEFPHTDGQIPLNLGMLLNTLNRDEIRGGDQQPGETDEEYQIRMAEENEILAELENQKLVTHGLVMFVSILTIILQAPGKAREQGVRAAGRRKLEVHLQVSSPPRGPDVFDILR